MEKLHNMEGLGKAMKIIIIIIILCLSLLVIGVTVSNMLPQNGNSDLQTAAEYMIEIRVENKTEDRFKNLKFGIVDAENTVLEDIDFKEDDENISSFWVGYTNTTEFYLEIKTSESIAKKTFNIKEKNRVDIPQQLLLILIRENGVLKIQESSYEDSCILLRFLYERGVKD